MIYKNYIITHKEFDKPTIDDNYITIQVGDGDDLGYLRDNSGDNIAQKNSSYCELTALYWIWKNDCNSSVVGISHYRRYFSKALFSFNSKNFLNTKDVKKILRNYDCIIAKPLRFDINLKKQYIKSCGYENDIEATRKVICDLYPNYIESFDRVMQRKYLSSYNMIIMKKEEYDDYCKWLFDILFVIESKININDYSNYEKRIFGFLSERLLNVWIDFHNYNIKYARVVNPFLTSREKVELFIFNLKTIIKNLIFARR